MDATTRELIALALREDIGPGDVTSQLLPADLEGRAQIVAKSDLVIAGSAAFIETYRQVDPRVVVRFDRLDGEHVAARTVIGRVLGPARALLTGERTALNLLQRLSGVATVTRRAVDLVAGTRAQIVDTRKTTPGLRALEKAAVRAGGGHNHRFGLFDGILIKDNHVAALGGVRIAIEAARREAHHLLRVECEVTDLEELEQALAAGADVVLLDNMSSDEMREAVERNKGRALLEASGNMTLARLPEVAATGVDLISMGAITHSAPAADLSLEWER
ncbi:MAG: carboxylating nicotinate-nucleotide diphosphorylase [Deltaproteobacteria bacterium]|nr:carboxylating nicotinate-nucleotide diphosphorylase [Deltaproteobacteria bacterium]